MMSRIVILSHYYYFPISQWRAGHGAFPVGLLSKGSIRCFLLMAVELILGIKSFSDFFFIFFYHLTNSSTNIETFWYYTYMYAYFMIVFVKYPFGSIPRKWSQPMQRKTGKKCQWEVQVQSITSANEGQVWFSNCCRESAVLDLNFFMTIVKCEWYWCKTDEELE